MKYLPVIVVLIALSATGEARKCYTCIDPPTEKCADPFSKDSGIKVTEFNDACLCMKATAITSNGTLVARSCMEISVSMSQALMAARKAADPTIKSMTIDLCSDDLCNGASTYRAALSTLMGIATLLVFSNWN